MKEKPILLNTEMVIAVLDGRKTQTRRFIKPEPDAPQLLEARTAESGSIYAIHANRSNVHEGRFRWDCPFGKPGDRLWVREKTRVNYLIEGNKAYVTYEADGEESTVPVPDRLKPIKPGHCLSNGCYREASRITLEITGVRVERLAYISDEDARNEGYPANPAPYGGDMDPWLWFRQLWDGIYPDKSFKVNPWVWVIDFKLAEE